MQKQQLIQANVRTHHIIDSVDQMMRRTHDVRVENPSFNTTLANQGVYTGVVQYSGSVGGLSLELGMTDWIYLSLVLQWGVGGAITTPIRVRIFYCDNITLPLQQYLEYTKVFSPTNQIQIWQNQLPWLGNETITSKLTTYKFTGTNAGIQIHLDAWNPDNNDFEDIDPTLITFVNYRCCVSL